MLKVSHHGSDSSTVYSFLKDASPRHAVICVGKDNDYGHPDEATLSKLRDADAEILRTDQLGDIVFYSDGTGLQLETQKKGAGKSRP